VQSEKLKSIEDRVQKGKINMEENCCGVGGLFARTENGKRNEKGEKGAKSMSGI